MGNGLSAVFLPNSCQWNAAYREIKVSNFQHKGHLMGIFIHFFTLISILNLGKFAVNVQRTIRRAHLERVGIQNSTNNNITV
jgi:hypothetical protein